MDFVKPNTIWIRDRCYRIISSSVPSSTYYEEDDLYPNNVYEDEIECGISDIPVEQLKNGKYISSIVVASMYYPYIIGGKGSTKRRIENETNCQIKIPPKGKSGDIVIHGKDVKTVRSARIKLELLVDQARKRQPFTHFLCLPVNANDIQQNYLKFCEEVLSSCSNCRGVDKSLFQSSEKLHLTFGVLVLADDRERQQVIKVLQECHQQIISEKLLNEQLRIEMRGIEYMNDDPGEVDVLYGKVKTISKHDLQDISDSYVTHLVNAGLMQRQFEKVKLHVTLMNTIFRKDAEGTVEIDNGPKRQRETFDARQIIQDFQDYQFGQISPKELHLSVRFSTSSTGFYTASCTLPLD